MNWHYAEGQQQRGPVTDTELENLVRAGTVKADTLVWREGMTDWQPYSQVTGASAIAGASIAGAPPAEGVVCHSCGKLLSRDEVIRYGDSWVCAACKPAFVQRLKEGAALPGALEYAGFWIRFVAKFVDGLIVGLPLAILLIVFVFSTIDRGEAGPGVSLGIQLSFQLVYYAVAGAYNIFFIGKYGATPGKMACKLRVVRADGGKVSYGRATGRFFAEILSGLICNIGYIIAAFDSEKRALHDHICATRVIKAG